MEILPIRTPLLQEGDNLAEILQTIGHISEGDIVVVSSKAFATVEGAAFALDTLKPSAKAKELAKHHTKSAVHYQAVINETERMNGSIIQTNNGVVLTELKPDGIGEGSVLVPNAGLDRSNIADGYIVGWPLDPVSSVRKLYDELDTKRCAIIMTDSGLCPRRRGVMAFALAVCGMDPLLDLVGKPDLFGQDMRMTEEAIADQLATAANFIMGNADQAIPAAIIRGHDVPFTDFCGWVPGIEREKDIYHGVI